MAENKNGFLLYKDLIHTVKKMPDDKAGILLKTILAYVNDEDPVCDDLVVDIVFEPIKQQMKRDLKSWEKKAGKKSENGVLGNLKRWHPDLFTKLEKGKISLEDAVKQADNRKRSPSDISDESNRNPIKSIANVAVNDNVTVTVNDNVTIKNRANALVDANAPTTPSAKAIFKNLVKELVDKDSKQVWESLRDFVNTHKPDFIEPYQETWNLFARTYGLSTVEVINDTRKKKLKTRLDEKAFDFIKILGKIPKSDMLRGRDTNSSWKVSFDWLLENQTNYVKVLEGNYDNN